METWSMQIEIFWIIQWEKKEIFLKLDQKKKGKKELI